MSKKKKKSHIPIRLNLLFSIIVLLLGVLIYKLIDLQLFNEKYYTNIITSGRVIKTTTDMTRGQIYDRNGVLLVGNQSFKTIDYTRYDNSVANMIALSTKLVDVINLDDVTITERQLKDYWIQTHTKELNDRLSATEKKLTGAELVTAQLNKVTADDIAYNEHEKKIGYLFSKMYNTAFLGTTTLKMTNISEQEIARVSEQLTALNGISIGSSWERTYPKGELLRELLGSVSSQQAGLPESSINQLLAQGYSRNSRVGTSYLEQQYDTVLRGTPKVTETSLDSNGAVSSSTVTFDGKSGNNIYLSIDSVLQQRVGDILSAFLYELPNSSTAYNESIYAIVQKVNTGEVLAISGKQFDYDSVEDKLIRNRVINDDIGAITGAHVMGSVIKPATVTAGYQHGIITESNNTILDAPMYFAADVSISSSFNRSGAYQLTDEMALARSSNIYMVKIAMGIGGQTYSPEVPLNIKEDTTQVLRKTFAEYGLGVYTGIDLPVDSRGYAPTNTLQSAALYNAFGQYDTYTTLQLSQFMTTIANGGYRFAPRLVTAIQDGKQLDVFDRLSTDMVPKVLNRVNITQGQMKRIHNGLYLVTHHYLGTESTTFSSYPIQVSGKTGTAEALYNGRVHANSGKYTITSTFASYAPSNNPEISVTVIIPNLSYETEYLKYTAGRVAKQIYDAYFFK